jgi:hypothetical protein
MNRLLAITFVAMLFALAAKSQRSLHPGKKLKNPFDIVIGTSAGVYGGNFVIEIEPNLVMVYWS